MIFLSVTVFMCLTLDVFGDSGISCKDDMGNSVDWFYGTKLPSHVSVNKYHLNESSDKGTAYLYLLASQPQVSNWTLSNYSVFDPNSMFARTLSVLYGNRTGLNYILYNDEEPDGRTTLKGGHMKGVLVFDDNNSFWLVHSVPRFPNKTSDGNYTFPSSGVKYAQSFLCISMEASQINSIGLQFNFTLPNVYDQHLEPWVAERFPQLWNWIANKTSVDNPPWYNITYITSLMGTQFTYFVKHSKFNDDLYSKLVAPNLTSDLWAETWQHGSGIISSDCKSSFTTENVKTIIIRSLNYSYINGQDHSKWAISSPDSDRHWVCIGDINRMVTQYKRSGGTVCLSSARVQLLYDLSTNSTESCPRTSNSVRDNSNSSTSSNNNINNMFIKLFLYLSEILKRTMN